MAEKINSLFQFSVTTWIAIASFLFVASLVSLVAGVSLFVPLASAGFAFCALLAIHRPLYLLGLLIVIRMSLDYSAQYLSVTVSNLTLSLSQLLGIAISCLGILLAGLHWKKISHFPLLVPFLIVFVWGILSVSFSIDPGTTLSELLRFFDLFVIGFLAYTSIHTPKDFRFLLLAILVSSITPVIFGVYQFAFGIGLSDEDVSVPRIFGTFSHPNVFSLYLFTVIALGLLAYVSYFRGLRERLLLGSFLFLLTGTLLLTYARVAWLSLLVFGVLLALWRYRLALLPLIFFPLLLFGISSNFQERVIQSFHPSPDSSITWRQNLWHDTILATQIDHRELFGHGMDTFRVVSENIRGTRFGSNESHNDFVKFYVEGGTIGILVFVAYLFSLFRFFTKSYSATRHHPRFFSTVLFTSFLFMGLLVASLSDNVFKNTPVQWLLWAVLGGLAALLQKKKESRLA